MSEFAARVRRIEVSSTALVLREAKRLAADGIKVVDLGAGEPDFPTPANIKLAAVRALERDFTRYTDAAGIAELREAIAYRHNQDYGCRIRPSQVIVTVGGKQAIFNALLSLVEAGDEVIIPAPYWVTFPQIVIFAGANPVYVPGDVKRGFKVTSAQIADKLSQRTKVVILNSPCNPTGAVIARQDFEAIVGLANERGFYVISDECYAKFVYDRAEPFSALCLDEQMRKRTIVINTLSKTYSMTGWRVGYAIASEDIIAQMLKIQSHSTSNPTSIAQAAAVEALLGPQDSVAGMIAEFRRRRDYIVKALNEIPGISCHKPEGAFYVFPDISSFLGRDGVRDSEEFCARLIREAHVAVTPGSAFGVDGFIRISYAAAYDLLQEGVARIADFVARLR